MIIMTYTSFNLWLKNTTTKLKVTATVIVYCQPYTVHTVWDEKIDSCLHSYKHKNMASSSCVPIEDIQSILPIVYCDHLEGDT